MCGLVGFVGRGDLEDLKSMAACLDHRGPDDEGFWHDRKRGIFLAHKRLSILDIEGGAQPMWTADGSACIVFNGEIYNHLELRGELEQKGRQFQSNHSDTETLLHGYLEWGESLPKRLNGMWAFAVLDLKNMRFFLSRDRFGKKPLFYTFQKDLFAFASELTALLEHTNINPSVSKRSLKKYFGYGFIPAPSSLYSNIAKLPGGHNLVVQLADRSFRLKKYWEFKIEPFEKIRRNPEEVWAERLRELLKRAVHRRMVADVPLGIFLSGGIDSSTVTAFASQLNRGHPIETFSIGFEEESFDESAYAQAVSRQFHTNHHNHVCSLERSKDYLRGILAKLDEPFGDSSILPTYLLCRETKKQVTVALGGDGGDELFAGYDPFKALHLASVYDKIIPGPVHGAIRLVINKLPVSHTNFSLDFKLKRTLRGLDVTENIRNPVWLGPLAPADLDDLFMENTDVEDVYSEAIECWDACAPPNLIDRTLQFYTRLYLQDDILVKSDRAGMMNSLEVRSPFLDIDLVDFVRRIPFDWKYRKGQTKYILKKAMTTLLPADIIYRPKKGFGAPIGRWLMNGSLPIRTHAKLPPYNQGYLLRKLKEHCEKKTDHRGFLWNWFVLENYLDIVNTR